MSKAMHTIYKRIFRIWRVKLMHCFVETLQPDSSDTLLDVGGYPSVWLNHRPDVKKVVCLNVHEVELPELHFDQPELMTVVGDGCDMEFPDRSFDILYSNSVIEHVGGWESQKAFAEEVRRVGDKLWVQTPAFECPLEPHFLAPFVHWLPASLRKPVVRWLTPWGWLTRPDRAEVENTVRHTRLLSLKQMKMLFPDCRIRTERLFLLFPKSYVAYRMGASSGISG